jgi:hypothetical protein
LLLDENPQQAAHLNEAEEAVAVANAAINMVAGALQTAAGFEHDECGFEDWMTSSSAAVEYEIASAQSTPAGASTTNGVDWDQVRADIGREIDRIFAEGMPTIFGPSARSGSAGPPNHD